MFGRGLAFNGSSAMKASERTRMSGEARCRKEYQVELAQGASHIASMLVEQTIKAAVQETVHLFAARNGEQDVLIFLYALTTEMERRGRPEALKILQEVTERADSADFAQYLKTLSSPKPAQRERSLHVKTSPAEPKGKAQVIDKKRLERNARS
jgi:hypothetical protein